MQLFTTRAYSLLPDADEMRSNGAPSDAVVLCNQSSTIELEAVVAEVEAFQQEHSIEIDSDVVDDQVMSAMIEFLNTNRYLDVPV